MDSNPGQLLIIGGGLAGSEAAWQASRRGCRVLLYEMKPRLFSPAHHSPLLAELNEAGRLGQKVGLGFFSYKNKKGKGVEDPAVTELIARHATGNREFTREELTRRLFLPMLLEATRVLDADLVRSVQDVDLGLIYGIGFPPFKGGLLFWADTLGAAAIIEMLKPWEHLGERYQPTPLLRHMAEEGAKFGFLVEADEGVEDNEGV